MRNALLLLLAIVGLLVWVRRHPRPFPAFLTPLLENPLRRLLLPAERMADPLGLEPGMRVLEIGPGGGYLTAALVRRLARGDLVCLDLQPSMLRKVRRRLGASEPRLVVGSGSVLPFRDSSFDRLVLSQVLGEIPDRQGALAELARVLAEHGELWIIEGLPDPDFIPRSTLCGWAERAGLRPVRSWGGWGHYAQAFGHRRASES